MTTLFSRLLTRKGYGVQSPFAYHIVRHVIGEQLPYYAYATLREAYGKHPDEPFLRLLLRLSNDLQPSSCRIDLRETADTRQREVFSQYILAGCKRCQIEKLTQLIPNQHNIVVVDNTRSAFYELINVSIKPEGCLALKRSKDDKKLWQEMTNHPIATQVFDINNRYALIFWKRKMTHAVYHL